MKKTNKKLIVIIIKEEIKMSALLHFGKVIKMVTFT